MKINTNSLAGKALIWAVAKAEWFPWLFEICTINEITEVDYLSNDQFIEFTKNKLQIKTSQENNLWKSTSASGYQSTGQSEQESVLKCLALTVFGDTIEIPDALA